jgi:transcriptional/translational regulatory protein YebC/TACO1
MAKTLKDIDSNKLGDYLEDYCNEEFNKRLRKFLVLDDPANIENILERADFEDITNEDVEVGIAVAEATLGQVNRVLKAQGIDFEFRRFDAIDYDSYMLVNTNEKLRATARRVREFPLPVKQKLVDAGPF